MGNARLQEFYENRYAAEGGKDFNVPVFDLNPYPDNRFEACIQTMCNMFKSGDILEVGAGNGSIAASLVREKLPFDRYVLTDLSQPRVEAARRALEDKRFETAVLNIESDESWPFAETDKFDCIMMVALIEHLVDPISAMRRLHRHLKDGGFVYVMTPNVARWVKRMRLLAGQFPSTASKEEGLRRFDGKPVDLHDEGHLHYFTFGSLSRMLTEYCGYSACTPAPYWEGTRIGPKVVEHTLARCWPGLFSELALVAYK